MAISRCDETDAWLGPHRAPLIGFVLPLVNGAGLESHYASFVRFEAPDSVTHAEVAAQVENAYQRALRGDRSGEGVISEARHFGSARADVLEPQLHVLTSQYRAATRVVTLARSKQAADPRDAGRPMADARGRGAQPA